jgi:hypothetical protein
MDLISAIDDGGRLAHPLSPVDARPQGTAQGCRQHRDGKDL